MLMVPLHWAECPAHGGDKVGEHRMDNMGQPQAGPQAERLGWDRASQAQNESQGAAKCPLDYPPRRDKAVFVNIKLHM